MWVEPVPLVKSHSLLRLRPPCGKDRAAPMLNPSGEMQHDDNFLIELMLAAAGAQPSAAQSAPIRRRARILRVLRNTP